MMIPPMVTDVAVQSGCGTARGRADTVIVKIDWIAIATPKDVMIIVVGSALRTGLKAICSIRTDPTTAASTPAMICSVHGSPM